MRGQKRFIFFLHAELHSQERLITVDKAIRLKEMII